MTECVTVAFVTGRDETLKKLYVSRLTVYEETTAAAINKVRDILGDKTRFVVVDNRHTEKQINDLLIRANGYDPKDFD